MNLSELKIALIQKINAIDDVALLMKISDLLDRYHADASDENLSTVNESVLSYEKARVFTEDEQRKINIALQQVENGEYISDEEAQIEIQKWFEEQEK